MSWWAVVVGQVRGQQEAETRIMSRWMKHTTGKSDGRTEIPAALRRLSIEIVPNGSDDAEPRQSCD